MADNNGAFLNPLGGVRIGTSVSASTQRFKSPLLHDGLGKLEYFHDQGDFMSGKSVYTNTVDTFSLNVGGSGTFMTGFGNVSAGLSVGYASADTSIGQDISLSMNGLRYSGLQYIDFNDLTFGEFIASFETAPREQLERCLDLFLKARKSEKKGSPDPQALKAWRQATEEFRQDFDDGMVVGVLWGGWGAAKLTFHMDKTNNKWKLSQTANFSYHGPEAAVSVQEALGLSHDKTGEQKNAGVSESYHGSCMADLIGGWSKRLRDIVDKEITELGSTTVGDLPTAEVPPPDKPELHKPPADKKVTSKIDKIKDLDGLKAYAAASAYEEYRAGGGKKSLKEFLEEAGEDNDVSGVPDVDDGGYDADDDDDWAGDEDTAPQGGVPLDAAVLGSAQRDASDDKGTDPRFGDVVVPLGVWVVGWGSLFPWMVDSRNNSIPKGSTNGSGLDTVLRLRMAQHDFVSLLRIYDRLVAEGYSKATDDMEGSFDEIRAAFEHASGEVDNLLSSYMRTKFRKGAEAPSVKSAFAAIIQKLGPGPQAIYKVWRKNPVLRGCELGAGIVFRVGSQARKVLVGPLPDKHAVLAANPYTAKDSTFDYEAWNTSVFAETAKAIPIILPDGRILAFIAGAPLQGDPADWEKYDHSDELTKGSGFLMPYVFDDSLLAGNPTAHKKSPYNQIDHPAVFEFASQASQDTIAGSTLVASYNHQQGPVYARLIPLPYKAAEGIRNWAGCAMTPSLEELQRQVDKIRDDLAALTYYSLDSDSWEGVAHLGDAMRMNQLRLSYIGLLPEPDNLPVHSFS